MANAPDRFALFILGPNEHRVDVAEDPQIANAATFTLNKEDHTMGNMLRHAVLVIPGVIFCGYRVPHPLEPRVVIKVQTDGSISPSQAILNGCNNLISQVGQVRNQFRNELQAKGFGSASGHSANANSFDANAPQGYSYGTGYGDALDQGRENGDYVDI
ncbi:RBP11-like subunits of RNA polymerase [Ceraceosorus guamensis]|uniref:RBP11-like subunits of RNA polymerase n=1 Tax=Ceraceosorus guamensis TaxID=1522189 RepID=A0A316VUX8_9BASI|nr:RBP11-like subunits of RNA polymerase [Ceraceosorus guamensis]PWN40708.1 RBP11-like subunits of RNA polymerase [Ceraceosorus guamensis]